MQRLSQAVEWIGAELVGADAPLTGACIDTRQLQAGQLFVALPGARVDGHDFVRKAASLGAGGALVSRPVDCALPQLVVPDVLAALQQLAARWRQLWAELSGGLLAGVTGSNGKTSVKTMLATMLQRRFEVFATPGNLNNHIGVPLCLLNLRPQHQRAVIEMGANHAGEIAQLANWARPDVGLVTNAGDAHLEGFGSRDGVALAKGELFAALGRDAIAIINADDAYAEDWRRLAAPAQVIEFGRGAAHVRAAEEVNAAAEQRFAICRQGDQQPVVLGLPGRHSVMNALAASAAAMAMGLELADAAAALAQMQPIGGRLQAQDVGGVHVINDAYNANPNSVAAAIEVLASRVPARHLVLGDMAELGAGAEQAHRQVGVLAREQGLEALWCCGPLSRLAADAFGAGAYSFDSPVELAAALRAQIKPGDSVLIKGSRSAGMERVLALLDEGC